MAIPPLWSFIMLLSILYTVLIVWFLVEIVTIFIDYSRYTSKYSRFNYNLLVIDSLEGVEKDACYFIIMTYHDMFNYCNNDAEIYATMNWFTHMVAEGRYKCFKIDHQI
jgi:hypothetical protein